ADDLAVVAIDEHTFSAMNLTWPMRRQLHADMLGALRKDGVRRVVYDVQFTEPSERPADDLALFDAVQDTPGTILATGESDAHGHTKVLGGDKQLAEIGARAADSTFPSDKAGVIRSYARENTHLASLATAAAASVGHPVAKDAFDGHGDALIDFRGPTGTIPTYSFVDVLRGRVPASKLRGKIVVVGATAPVLQDIHATSAAGARMMPGPEIQANAIWTALHGNPLRQLPRWATTVLALLLGLVATFLVARFGTVRALLPVALIGAAYLGASILAFGQGTVVPMAEPLLALGAAAIAAAVVMIAGELALRAHLARYSEQLEAEVAERTAALASSQLEVVLRLARAAELRDDDTGEHIDRMSEMCGQVALELGQSPADAEMLRHAAALHDIGKIGVPDSILLKPGRLTDGEFDVMREHVVAGAELLVGSDAPVLQLAETVARTHHEKFDGTGYPAKLVGEAIPLPGRIAAVCDVFDALTHERPYKQAWSLADACAEIERCRGGHFDPDIVDAFMRVVVRQFGPIPAPTAKAA
ncbi:MAG: CHASE2 domain-containing protein, partial [Solirubrobacteraceae bacterium]|nr:CHASE2 domain-containing protein [Patulibacter sp.]